MEVHGKQGSSESIATHLFVIIATIYPNLETLELTMEHLKQGQNYSTITTRHVILYPHEFVAEYLGNTENCWNRLLGEELASVVRNKSTEFNFPAHEELWATQIKSVKTRMNFRQRTGLGFYTNFHSFCSS